MKILAIVPYLYNISPGQRYRIEQWEPILRQNGASLTFVPFENRDLNRRIYQPGQYGRKARAVLQATGRRLKLPRLAREFDAIYIYREAALLGPAWLENLIARQNIPIVYDFDDAIYLPAVSEANSRLGLAKNRLRKSHKFAVWRRTSWSATNISRTGHANLTPTLA